MSRRHGATPASTRRVRRGGTPRSCGPWSPPSTGPRTPDPDGDGPLQELLDGSPARSLRCAAASTGSGKTSPSRSCDSWVIPYIADLLATNLVPSMDARGQRLDVANTIYYRRRKGTVALLEQLAADVTGYDARVIEFFRRLGRAAATASTRRSATRAGSPDPAAARRPAAPRRPDRPAHRHAAGRLADLRDPLGARMTGTAYDEYHHRADVRQRRRAPLGWYGIQQDRVLPVADGWHCGSPGHPGAGQRLPGPLRRSTRPAGRSRCSRPIGPRRERLRRELAADPRLAAADAAHRHRCRRNSTTRRRRPR